MATLDGLVALVTGASSGIGEEVAVRLAVEGAKVVVNGREQDEVQRVVDRIRALGGSALAAVGDVAEPQDVDRVVAAALSTWGAVDVLVNNAGFQEERPFLELDLASWRAQLSVDLDGAFLMSLACCREMARHGSGVVINITSVHEHQPRPGYAAYCTAKAGLAMLTQVLARELAEHGIRAVNVAPGAIATPIQGQQDAQAKQTQRDGIPAGRLGQPEEVAALVAFLASPAAAYVSGTTVVIDGALETQVSLS